MIKNAIDQKLILTALFKPQVNGDKKSDWMFLIGSFQSIFSYFQKLNDPSYNSQSVVEYGLSRNRDFPKHVNSFQFEDGNIAE